VRLLHAIARTSMAFDDPNIVSAAGLVPLMALADRLGLPALAAGARPDGPAGANPALKIACLIAGMAAGADSIDDMDVLRHGAMGTIFGGIRAPSTLGSFLRSFTWGNVSQLQKAHRGFLAALCREVPVLPGAGTLAFIDIDATQNRVYGYQKEGARYGHTKIAGKSVLVKGLNVLAGVISTPLSAPVIASTRLRAGSASSTRGAASLVTETIATARRCGCTGQVVVRLDSGYYNSPVVRAIMKAGAFFSVTVAMNPPRQDGNQHHHRRRVDPGPLPAGDLGRAGRRLGLRRRDRRDHLHGVHLEKDGRAGHRPAHRPPGEGAEQEGRRRAGRAVPRLALPRRVH
jgi:Transposase DDE domain group 1